MRCAKAWVEPFELTLPRVLRIGGYNSTSRSGAWLYIEDELGNVGQGEVAPLPQLSSETLEQALDQMQAVSRCLVRCELPENVGSADALFDGMVEGKLLPSVRLGVGMAVCTLAWRKNGTLNALEDRCVKLNGLVMGEEAALLDQVAALLDEGYSSIKVKVGRCSLEQDIRRIHRIKEMIASRATLRLDANQAWSLDQATRFANEIGPEMIEYIEEPVADPRVQVEFHRRTGMPLAIDESLGQALSRSTAGLIGVVALILKPTILGGLGRVQSLIDLARTRRIKAILSSTFESAVALRFYASLVVQQGLSHETHGLDTWRWLPPEHVATWLAIKGPCIYL